MSGTEILSSFVVVMLVLYFIAHELILRFTNEDFYYTRWFPLLLGFFTAIFWTGLDVISSVFF